MVFKRGLKGVPLEKRGDIAKIGPDAAQAVFAVFCKVARGEGAEAFDFVDFFMARVRRKRNSHSLLSADGPAIEWPRHMISTYWSIAESETASTMLRFLP